MTDGSTDQETDMRSHREVTVLKLSLTCLTEFSLESRRTDTTEMTETGETRRTRLNKIATTK